MTVEELINSVSNQFAEANLFFGHGTDNPWDEAVALVLTVLKLPDSTDVLNRAVDEPLVQEVRRLATRRIDTRQPLAYLLGKTQYAGLEFAVEPGVIVPRSPLGLLFGDIAPWLPDRVACIVDACAGSGAIGIVAAHAFPDAQVHLLEMDDAALALAQRNVQRHNLQSRVHVHACDVTQPWPEAVDNVDLALANPPYVSASDMRNLPPEYTHEPKLALAAGESGLDVITGIFTQLRHRIASHGLLVGEVGLSDEALQKAYPDVPFIWPELTHGGEGVFLLEAEHLNSHTLALPN